MKSTVGRRTRPAVGAAWAPLAALVALSGCALLGDDELRPSLLAEAGIELVDCPEAVADQSTACGLVEVPIDHDDPSAGTIELSVLERAGGGGDEILAVLQGGPGAASSELSAFASAQPFTQVFLDQRGVGFASVDFDCPELQAAFDAVVAVASGPGERIRSDALARCAQRLRGDRNFVNLTSATHARDLVAVMDRFDRPWSAYGVSYGSTIVLEAARLSPDQLEGIIVDGVYPPDLDIEGGVVASAAAALATVSDACGGDEQCVVVAPDLERSVNELVVAFNQDPIEATTAGRVVTIDGTALAETIFALLYSERRVAGLPALIEGLEAGAAAAIEQLVELRVELSGNSIEVAAEGTYFGVQCRERLAATATPIDEPESPSPFAVSLRTTPLLQACRPWVDTSTPEPAGSAVESDIEALLLSGELDPITPPQYGQWVARGLSNATLVVRGGRSHGVWLGDDCVSVLIRAFVGGDLGPDALQCNSEPVEIGWQESLLD